MYLFVTDFNSIISGLENVLYDFRLLKFEAKFLAQHMVLSW